jgi:hypothetical protein
LWHSAHARVDPGVPGSPLSPFSPWAPIGPIGPSHEAITIPVMTSNDKNLKLLFIDILLFWVIFQYRKVVSHPIGLPFYTLIFQSQWIDKYKQRY